MSVLSPTGPDVAATDDGESFRSSLGQLFLLTLLFFMSFMARIVQAPLMPAIEKDLHITHAEAGSLFFILSAGYFITLMGSGFVSARITHRWTMVLSIACTGLALLATAASESLWQLRAGLFLTGLCAGLYLPSAIAAITGFVSPRHWGKAIAIHEVAPNLAFVLAPLFAEALLALYPWKIVLAVLGVGAILSGAAFLRFARVGAFAGESPNFRLDRCSGPPAILLADDPVVRPRHQRQPRDLHHAAAVSGERSRPRARFRQHAAGGIADSRSPGGLRQRLVHRPHRAQTDHPSHIGAQRPADHGVGDCANGLVALS